MAGEWRRVVRGRIDHAARVHQDELPSEMEEVAEKHHSELRRRQNHKPPLEEQPQALACSVPRGCWQMNDREKSGLFHRLGS